jgi:hypothetical protein
MTAQSALKEQLYLVEIKPGLKFSATILKQLLPDVETTLFFAKLYGLNANQLGNLLSVTHNSSVIDALVNQAEGHSQDLQDYVLELGYEWLINSGEVTFSTAPPKGEILPELWKSLEVQVAKSIQEVADKLRDVVDAMPGKVGEMVFKSLMTVNAKRPILGDYKAHVHHAPQRENLVILDVSGSMTEGTIGTIVEDVVALSYLANAHLAIVSNTATHWGPGEYDVDSVLKVAEYSGTHYETLSALLDQDWGVVVTIADYDSSPAAASAIRQCSGRIEQVLDISLVNRPTYLAEVVGQLASDVRPLLVAATDLTGSGW